MTNPPNEPGFALGRARRRAVLGAFGAFASALALPRFAPAAPSGEPFRIGAVLPKSGVFSQYGVFIEQGLRVAVAQLIAADGILGRPVQLVVRDDAGNPGRTLLAAKELVEEQKVNVLYPEVVSGLALAVLPYTSSQKVLTISSGASATLGDAKRFPYSFQLADIVTNRAEAVAFALKKMGGKKVGIFVSTNPPQTALGDALSGGLLAKEGLEVAKYIKFTDGAKDMVPQLQQLRDAGADIIAFDSGASDGVRVLMTGLQTMAWKAKVISEPGVLHGDLTEQVPAPVHDQFFAVNYRIGTLTKSRSSAVDAFIADLKKDGPITNLPYSALARDAVYLAKWAFETAQKEKGNTNPDTLRELLEQKRALPAGAAIIFQNPYYSAADHTTVASDYSQMWGLVRVSKPVDGAYEGEELVLPR